MSKHTPGPWTVKDIGANCLRVTVAMPLANIQYDLRDYYATLATVAPTL